MSPENYASLKNKGVSPHVIIDTADFQKYCIQHGYDNNKFHKDIWRPFMLESMDTVYSIFERTENPENKLEELINSFLDDYPEFENEVKMMFTD